MSKNARKRGGMMALILVAVGVGWFTLESETVGAAESMEFRVLPLSTLTLQGQWASREAWEVVQQREEDGNLVWDRRQVSHDVLVVDRSEVLALFASAEEVDAQPPEDCRVGLLWESEDSTLRPIHPPEFESDQGISCGYCEEHPEGAQLLRAAWVRWSGQSLRIVEPAADGVLRLDDSGLVTFGAEDPVDSSRILMGLSANGDLRMWVQN